MGVDMANEWLGRGCKRGVVHSRTIPSMLFHVLVLPPTYASAIDRYRAKVDVKMHSVIYT